MANPAKLKEKARSLEQREQWKEALDVYQRLVEDSTGDEVDIALWNRIGDLHLRVGQTDRAVEAYDHAVDAYAEAGLHNNAIALCRKILRIAPSRATVYLRLGQISAAHGFLGDARQNFLEYAQRMQRVGEIDASFTALKEFADLSPDDTELRLLLAEQLRAHGREGEALEQLRLLYAHLLRSGNAEEGEEIGRRILALDPGADLAALLEEDPTALSIPPEGLDASHFALEGLEHTALDAEPADVHEVEGELELAEIQPIEGLETAGPELELDDLGSEGAIDLPLLDMDAEAAEDEEEEVVGEALPLLDFASPEEYGTAPGAVDISQWGLEIPETAPVDPLEELRARVAASPEDEGALREYAGLLQARGQLSEASEMLVRAHAERATAGLYIAAIQAIRLLIERRPAETALYQKQVEYAFRAGDAAPLVRAYLDLARHLGSPAEHPKARAVYQRVLELDPGNPAATEALRPRGVEPPSPSSDAGRAAEPEYIDLGALIFDDEAQELTTRFVVAEEEPTGDEDRDFQDMLAVFRKKVSENIAAEDSHSHYDLGVAFKEMGLVDEAIAEFQVALRGGANPLATLEALGQCFVEKGQHAVASRVLERALRLPGNAEVDLVGIIYQLGRCEEALGQAELAREHYERVIAHDIGFRDAGNRLERLRAEEEAGRF